MVGFNVIDRMFKTNKQSQALQTELKQKNNELQNGFILGHITPLCH